MSINISTVVRFSFRPVAAVKLVTSLSLPDLQLSCMFSRFRINRFAEQHNRQGAKKKKGTKP
jgi:hypothetical protein